LTRADPARSSGSASASGMSTVLSAATESSLEPT